MAIPGTAPWTSRQPTPVPAARVGDARPFASPYVRRQALARGVEWTAVRPGAHRRVTLTDVEAASAQRTEPARLPETRGLESHRAVIRIDVTGIASTDRPDALVAAMLCAIGRTWQMSPPTATRGLRVVRYGAVAAAERFLEDPAAMSWEGMTKWLRSGADAPPGASSTVSLHDLSGTGVARHDLARLSSDVVTLCMGTAQPAVMAAADGRGGHAIAIRDVVDLAATYASTISPPGMSAFLIGVQRGFTALRLQQQGSA